MNTILHHIGKLLLAITIITPFNFAMAQDKTTPTEGELTLAITGLRNNNGNVVLTFFNNIEDFYEKDNNYFKSDTVSLAGQDKKAKTKIVRYTLPIGRYVIFAFHDEDKNGRMAKSLLGSNLEGGGYANHFKGSPYRRPQFRDAAIEITEKNSAVGTIRLLYSEPTF
ncbi:MAG: DUF2141 domain-containing protein [Rikenellaceae bacterium]